MMKYHAQPSVGISNTKPLPLSKTGKIGALKDKERDRETERERQRQTDKQTDRQTENERNVYNQKNNCEAGGS